MPQWTGMILMLDNLQHAKKNVWCDYCKYAWGVNHPKGQTQAAWTIVSKLPASHGRIRHLCQACVVDVSRWADGSYFPLPEQIAYALRNQPTQEALNGF